MSMGQPRWLSESKVMQEVREYPGKRALDILGSILALLFFSVPILVLAILVRLKLGSPIFFRQERAGTNGRSFWILKFRTMTDERDETGAQAPDSIRLTSFGRFLRSTSLDELPELVNILRGEMSFVGPRPLPTAYVSRYSAEQVRRLEARPGLTGWAQINGRNTVDWEERFKLDLWYVDRVSFLLDVRIFLLTFGKVLARDGIAAVGEVTMTEFRGNPEKSSSFT